MRINFLAISLVGIMGLGLAPAVQAHPHVWINASWELRLTGRSVDAFHVRWEFDPGYSAVIAADVKPGPTGKFSNAGIKYLYTSAFSNLKNFGYFTKLYWNKKRINILGVKNFTAFLDDQANLVYEFDIAVKKKVPADGATLAIMQYDETYFVDIERPDLPKVSNGTQVSYTTSKAEVPSMAVYGGVFIPEQIIIRLKTK